MSFRSRSPRETEEAGEDLASCIDERGLVVALEGPLGAGKTLFVRGLAKGLGVDPGLVASPSFVVASEYLGPRRLAHVDLFRVGSAEELETAGFLDLLEPGAVVAVEWADRLPAALPEDRLEVKIERGPARGAAGDSERKIDVRGLGGVAREVEERWWKRRSV